MGFVRPNTGNMPRHKDGRKLKIIRVEEGVRLPVRFDSWGDGSPNTRDNYLMDEIVSSELMEASRVKQAHARWCLVLDSDPEPNPHPEWGEYGP